MPNYVSKIKPDGMGGTEYNIKDAELREAFDVLKEDIKGTQTATGNPITLTDASETYAQGLTVELEPKQDLHGQSAPYVGGAGKNKWGYGISTTPDVSGSYGGWYIPYITNVTLKLFDKGTTVDLTNVYLGLSESGTSTPVTWVLNNGVVQSSGVISSTNYHYVSIYPNNAQTLEKIFAKFNVLCVVDNADSTTYAPYSNICPISGYDWVEVDDVGVNQWDEEWETGVISISNGANISGNGIRSKNYCKCKPTTSYYLYVGQSADYVFWYDKDNNFIEHVYADSSKVITSPSNAYYFKIRIDGISTYANNVSINYPATDTNYHPYQSRTASVTFGQTVYGGRSNFTEGGTDVDKTKVKISDLTPQGHYNGTNASCSLFSLSDNATTVEFSQAHGCISDRMTENVAYFGWQRTDDPGLPDMPFFAINTDGNTLALYDEDNTLSQSDFLEKYGDTEICYPKATPTTIATPPTDLKLLQDTNNLTTNGTTITLDYIPNNSIGDAVKASEEYTDRAVGRVAPKATLIDTWMISEESDTISVDLTSYDCNFFLLEYLFNSKRGTTLIPRPQGGSFSASVVTYNNGSALYIELTYNPTTKELAYTSNVTSQFGILAIYTI